MINEAGDNIGRVIAIQTQEVERGLGQQGAAPGVAEVQEQQRRAEQERFMQQRNGGLGMGVPESPEFQMPYVQPPVLQQSHAPQQNTIPEQIPGLYHASVPPAGPQGYNPVPLNNPGPIHPQPPVPGQVPGYGHLPTHIQAPAYPHNPVHAQLPAHPFPQPFPVQRQDSVYTETSTTSSEDSEIRIMLAKELKKQKQKDRAAKRMAKMKRERERGDFCKRCGRC
ncbi:hypothetical protein H9Q73_002504 [Fusarium xylarioides]|nr:hypothetical protein H9Q73_002504 [Fusarium xylarioides]